MSEESKGPWSGAIGSAGVASVIRIPLPGESQLAVEFWPRNFKGESTSVVFIQDIVGKKVLRLDYGYNKNTKMIDYHWNQKGTFQEFGIADHALAGRPGAYLYGVAKGFRWAGRVLLVVGLVLDGVSIVVSDRPLRRATQVVTGWAVSIATAERAGTIGAEIGTAIEPGAGTAIGAFIFAIGGGILGYSVGSDTAGEVYDWSDAHFFPLPSAPLPSQQ